MKKRTHAGVIALCGILAAVAVVIMLLAELIPAATFCCPLLVIFLMVPVINECGSKWAIVWYISVCVLSVLLTFANPEATMIYVFLGYYPVLRKRLNRVNLLPLRLILKLLMFNSALVAAYACLLFLLQVQELMAQLQTTGKWLLLGMIILANICFFLADFALGRCEVYYAVKIRRKLQL